MLFTFFPDALSPLTLLLSDGGLQFGQSTAGYFSVTGIDMRDPYKFLNCPAGTTPSALESGKVCCKNAAGICPSSANKDGEMVVPNMGIMIRATINFGNFSSICHICEDSSGKGFSGSSTCRGVAGELAVSVSREQFIFCTYKNFFFAFFRTLTDFCFSRACSRNGEKLSIDD